MKDYLILDIVHHRIGIEGDNGQMIPILEKNLILPDKKSFVIKTWKGDREKMEIFIYEGES